MRRRPRLSPYVTNPGRAFEVVLVDMNTQKDFLLPGAPAVIVSRQLVVDNVKRIFQWAADHDTFMVSSLDVHRHGSESRFGLPRHCIFGSNGANKMPFSLLSKRVLLDDHDPLSLPVDLTATCRQVIFPKWYTDLWSNPRADRLLSGVRARGIAVFGVGIEHSLRLMVLGLRTRGYAVRVITDASGGWDAQDVELSLRVMQAKGAKLVTTQEFLQTATALRRRRRPKGILEPTARRREKVHPGARRRSRRRQKIAQNRLQSHRVG